MGSASNMTPLHILQLSNVSIFNQLQIEEALLRTDQRNWCIINEGSPPAIVMGISGKYNELIHHEKLVETPIPVIRRFSGGGTVVVDANTHFITFICNTTFIPIKPFPEHIMRWTENIYQPVFSPHPFRLYENDYVMGLKKFGGNAQSICKGRWLHHSSFLWDYSPDKMEYLKIPNKAPSYRLQRTHDEFLCRIRDYLPERHLFIDKFLKEIKSRFLVKEVEKEQVEKMLCIPHRKATAFIDREI